jgi:hypothetical protein
MPNIPFMLNHAIIIERYLIVFCFNFNPDSAIGIVGQQKISTILGAHGLFWIEGIASYFEIQNGSKCLRLKKNEVE